MVFNLHQHNILAKNIDMGQRNQIRGQREREKKQAAAWRRNSVICYMLVWQRVLHTVVHHSQHIKPAEAAVT